MTIPILAIIGLLLSLYALYVKTKAEKNKKYKPLCDISENISCTKAFLSKEGSLTGFPNPLIGIFYYVIIFSLFYIKQNQIIFYFSFIAALGSLYLAYLSYIKQKNFCLVCTGIYVVNILLMVSI
ncbi:vitamin K epoxide reductase family protein [Candidatus Woesearchaeota archaeon]|nr:vitamin K epoxide reductase family protein [Candidatus Woesearchaeota archaeon]